MKQDIQMRVPYDKFLDDIFKINVLEVIDDYTFCDRFYK